MSVDAFFDRVGPALRGAAPLDEELQGLQFYVELMAADHRRILAEMYPAVRRLVERAGRSWAELAAAFLAEHPPRGWSVPHVGHGFADWLHSRPDAPPAAAAVAELAWTRFLVRVAPDDAPLLLLRHFEVDAVAITAALLHDEPVPDTGPTTRLVYRHDRSGRVLEAVPSLASLALLLRVSGQPAPPGLVVSEEALAAEQARWQELGIRA